MGKEIYELPRSHPAFKNVRPPQLFKTLIDPGVYGPELGFRPNTKVQRISINFAFNEGGLGDYLNYSAATLWLAKNAPWVDGKLFVSEYLAPFIKLIHKDYPHWEIFPGEKAGDFIDPQSPIVGPELKMNGQNVNPQLVNATGSHLLDLGFAYYCGMLPAPKDATLPRVSIPASYLPDKIKKLEGKYIVVPTGTMVPSRFLTGAHINPLLKFINDIGYTPVLLGKSQVAGNLSAHFSDDINYSLGLDLRDQTTIMDAAVIMQHAALTVGLDSGLLHLAACMDNSNVVFGYSLTRPEKRRPRRNWGKLVDVFLSDDELICSGCQDKWKSFVLHTFHVCFYKDNKCLDMLFENDAERFKVAIKQILEIK